MRCGKHMIGICLAVLCGLGCDAQKRRYTPEPVISQNPPGADSGQTPEQPPVPELPPTPERPTPREKKAFCGNGVCEASNNETPNTCPKDCAGPRCGDGTCDSNEDPQRCPLDCKAAARCGDGKCDAPEDSQSCPADCKAAARCGDGSCDAPEDPQSCPADCKAPATCGDGKCEAPEDARSCPADCKPPSKCGNGVCDPGEKPGCPQDCCAALTAERYINNEGNNAEFTAKFFPTKNRNGEYIDMFFRSNATGTFQYGAGPNADLYTCKQCMLVVRNKKNFYPIQGSITIKPGSQPMKKRLFAELSQLVLIEIKISSSYHSIPVKGGECVTLAPAKIDVR